MNKLEQLDWNALAIEAWGNEIIGGNTAEHLDWSGARMRWVNNKWDLQSKEDRRWAENTVKVLFIRSRMAKGKPCASN